MRTGKGENPRVAEFRAGAQAEHEPVVVQVVHVQRAVGLQRRGFPGSAGDQAVALVQAVFGAEARDQQVAEAQVGLVAHGVVAQLALEL